MVKKFLFKCLIIICIILTFIIKMAPYVVDPGHTEQLYQGLYNKDSSYDVLFMGSSHMNGMMDQVYFIINMVSQALITRLEASQLM